MTDEWVSVDSFADNLLSALVNSDPHTPQAHTVAELFVLVLLRARHFFDISSPH
jgi:hypothetical protein